MNAPVKDKPATIIPTMRYRDAIAALEWLCNAFGFEKHLIVPGENGSIVHAQLVFGNGMIMLGSVRNDDFDQLQQPPSREGSVVSQSPYIVVEDVDEHYARAIAAGAEIVIPLKMKTTEDATIPAVIQRVFCGILAPIILGEFN
jgi:uncharacterized glyoxalase superfamily protein PhnB